MIVVIAEWRNVRITPTCCPSLVSSVLFVVSTGAAFLGLIAAGICWLAMISATRIAPGRKAPV